MFLSSKMLFKKKQKKKDWVRDIGVWEEVHWLGGKKKRPIIVIESNVYFSISIKTWSNTRRK